MELAANFDARLDRKGVIVVLSSKPDCEYAILWHSLGGFYLSHPTL